MGCGRCSIISTIGAELPYGSLLLSRKPPETGLRFWQRMAGDLDMTAAEKLFIERKIKTPLELSKLLGAPTRKQKVIMCHGAFDLVHPGHIRHLIYAKGKASILIASLTGDAHILKANHRPFVPEDLRAMNLAALEMVDYVVIDPNPTPLENLRIIQPDYFAKGYEYSRDGVHPRTRQELEIVESYGGELIFTSGDIVYSSSAHLDSQPPNLAFHKVAALMVGEGGTFDHLAHAVHHLHEVKSIY